MNAEQFGEAIKLMEGFWPRAEFPDNMLDVWWPQMQRWESRYVQSAIRKLARESKWLPAFAELAEAVRIERTIDLPRRAGPRDQAPAPAELRERWSRVIIALGKIGEGKSDAVDAIRVALRRHYTRDGVYVEVAQPDTMLRDAEAALASLYFTNEGDE